MGIPFSARAQTTIQISKAQPVTIFLPATPIASEETAAQELEHYLHQITGATCTVEPENKTASSTGTAIYVGATLFAAQHVKGAGTFADEEWVMQTQGKSLVLTGGQPRGTLYATYHFLEDVCGVHWWTPWAESVPTQKVIAFSPLDKHGKPAFHYRDIYSLYGNDNGRFAARSRIDRQGYAPIDMAYGGSRAYGPPGEVHTFFDYMPPQKYYKDHPDWYIIRGSGPPTLSNSQLCLANKGMRAEFLKLLRENIRTSRQAAIAKHLPPPEVYDVSQNDGGVSWVGDADKDLVKKEGSDAAAMVDFVNYLADGIRDEFPTVYITTLAYHSGEKAPKTLRPRDNVIIRLTDTQSNVLLPVTAERNRVLHQNVEDWAKLAKNLRIWDYDITYIFPSLPTPTIDTYSPDLQFFLNHNVEGMFVEFEKPDIADMRDLKLWVLCKLLEDPSQKTDALVHQFTGGYYGAAGTFVRQYLAALQQSVDQTAAKQGMPEVTWFSGLSQFSYLTPAFLQQANQIFNQAAAAVAGDAVLSQRVRNARSSVDYAILMLYPRLMKDWVDSGHSAASMLLNRELIGKRLLQTRNEQISLWYPADAQEVKRKAAEAQIADLTSGPDDVPLPDQFKNIPSKDILTYGFRDADPTYGDVFPDPTAPSGMVKRLLIPDNQAEKYKLPMPWGVYGKLEQKTLLQNTIQAADVPGAGYHWYKLGLVTPTSSSYLFLTWSWYLQVHISDAANSVHPNQQYEVWANLKFDGPLFPYGDTKEKNAILLDRVVLVKH